MTRAPLPEVVRGFLPAFAVAPAVTLGLGTLPLSRRFSVRRARGDHGAIDRGRPSFKERVLLSGSWAGGSPWGISELPALRGEPGASLWRGGSRFKPLSLKEMEDLPPPQWLIGGLAPADGLVVLYGEPGAGKSFVALDWGLSVATGAPWLGREVKQGEVVYIGRAGAYVARPGVAPGPRPAPAIKRNSAGGGMREIEREGLPQPGGDASNVRNWALGLLLAALILSAPVIAFVMVVTVEMLTDLMAKMGATAVWPVAAGAVGWVLLRKYGWQPWTSRLRSEGA
jgi:hypothetical protein